MTVDALKNIQVTLSALANDEPIPEAVRDWLYQGLSQHDSGYSLESAFLLTFRDRTTYRNRAFQAAANALGDAPPWQKALQLEKAIERFEARVWPKVRHYHMPELPPVDEALFLVFKSGARPLRCARKIYEIIR